jgi:hypothetical protein
MRWLCRCNAIAAWGIALPLSTFKCAPPDRGAKHIPGAIAEQAPPRMRSIVLSHRKEVLGPTWARVEGGGSVVHFVALQIGEIFC